MRAWKVACLKQIEFAVNPVIAGYQQQKKGLMMARLLAHLRRANSWRACGKKMIKRRQCQQRQPEQADK